MPGSIASKGKRHYVRTYVGDGRYKWSHGFGSKREAEAFLQQTAVLPMYGCGRGRNFRGERFRAYADRWLQAKAKGHLGSKPLRPRTLDTYRLILARHVLPEVGFVPLDKFDSQRLRNFFDHLQEKGLGQTSRHHVYRLVKLVFSDAIAEEIILKSPVTFKGPGRKTHRVRVLSEEETRRILEEAKRSNPPLYRLLLVAASTGQRTGELLAAGWRDVDLEERMWTVEHTLQRLPGGGWVLAEPKTERGRRSIPLTPEVVTELRALKVAQAKARLASGICGKGEDCRKADCMKWHDVGGFVLSQANGKPGHANNIVHRAFRGVLKRAGLPPMRLHDFGRHAFASYLHRQGVSTATISALLGHSSTSFTLATYVSELEAEKWEAAETIGEVLRGIGAKR